jgi:hypothetical protein
LQFPDDPIRHLGNVTAKVDQTADPVAIPDFVLLLPELTMHKNITGKQGFNHLHHPAPGVPFDLQPGVEHPELEVFAQICGGDVFVLRLGPRTIPSSEIGLHSTGFPHCNAR